MDVNLLPDPQSRAEIFLDYIARNSNDLSKLPIPYSRIELFLDYIARNMNTGSVTLPLEIKDVNGLEDTLNKNIVNLNFDEITRILTATKADDTAATIDLTSLETKWENLEFANEIIFTNLIHGLTAKTGHYEQSGNLNNNRSFRSYAIPCIPGKTYRRANISGFQNTVCNLRGGNNGETFIKNIFWKQTPLRIGNRQIWEVTIPLDSNINHFTLSYNNDINPSQGTELMAWDASIDPPSPYVQQTAKSEGAILNSKIKMEFKPFQTGLTSTTIDDAIREIALKLATIEEVQSVNGQSPNE